jgi:hypothetical protein
MLILLLLQLLRAFYGSHGRVSRRSRSLARLGGASVDWADASDGPTSPLAAPLRAPVAGDGSRARLRPGDAPDSAMPDLT